MKKYSLFFLHVSHTLHGHCTALLMSIHNIFSAQSITRKIQRVKVIYLSNSPSSAYPQTPAKFHMLFLRLKKYLH
jgi:hypothetical protein